MPFNSSAFSVIEHILYNMLCYTFARRPGPRAPAASGITIAWPGHHSHCAQAPVRLVAYSAAAVVTCQCSRLVVRKIRSRARGPVWLLATHAYPASDGLHGQFKFCRLTQSDWLRESSQRQELWLGRSQLWHTTWPVAPAFTMNSPTQNLNATAPQNYETQLVHHLRTNCFITYYFARAPCYKTVFGWTSRTATAAGF